MSDLGTRLAARHLLELLCFAAIPLASLVLALAVFAEGDRIALDFTTAYRQAELVLAGDSPYADPDTDVSVGSIGAWPMTAILPAVPLTFLPLEPARWLVTILMLAAFVGTLYVLGIRDWRVGGVALLWPPIIDGYQTANVSLALGLLVALAWRYRDRAVVCGLALGGTIALKFFLWPLVAFYAATRRFVATAIALVLGGTSLLLIAPFADVSDYMRLVENLSRTFDEDSYTPFALLALLGVPDTAARAATYAIGIAVFALACRRRSLTLALATAFVFSPIIWRHYFALLLVPMAISYPRFHPAWLIPLGFWLVPGTYNGGSWHSVAIALTVAAATFAAAELASNRAVVARAPARIGRAGRARVPIA